MVDEREVLDYHSSGENSGAGKIEIKISKPCENAKDLSLAYTPGVAIPCLKIFENKEDAYKYTNKENLVAVVSNGTAVLGLGNIGALASKPVMEGKAVLFKKFGDVNSVDILINSEYPKEVIEVARLISPTFGGINLEDIKAPECFYIEEELKKLNLGIPIFHDDQHGTAIVSGAGLLNALEIVGKKINEIKCVFSGAGAAGIACAKHYNSLGVPKKNIILVDTKGVIYKGRTEGMNKYKEEFAVETSARTLSDAMKGADVVVGVSGKDLFTREMILSLAQNPIVFAMANPNPEINYDLAKETRNDIIIGTGRSDFPNQVNNVLGFPYIFRGALDVRAKEINEEMKIAATHALAKIAKMPVTEEVVKAYGKNFEFGRDYILTKPFDKRNAVEVSFAVAKAAIESGVAQKKNFDLENYYESLKRKFNKI